MNACIIRLNEWSGGPRDHHRREDPAIIRLNEWSWRRDAFEAVITAIIIVITIVTGSGVD